MPKIVLRIEVPGIGEVEVLQFNKRSEETQPSPEALNSKPNADIVERIQKAVQRQKELEFLRHFQKGGKLE